MSRSLYDQNMGMIWLLVLLTWLATHRVTRLLTRDHLPLIAIPRNKIILWLDPPVAIDGEAVDPPPSYPLGLFGRSLAFLLECDWCMSVYVAGGIVLLEMYVFHLAVPFPLLLWASASTVTGLVATAEPD